MSRYRVLTQLYHEMVYMSTGKCCGCGDDGVSRAGVGGGGRIPAIEITARSAQSRPASTPGAGRLRVGNWLVPISAPFKIRIQRVVSVVFLLARDIVDYQRNV